MLKIIDEDIMELEENKKVDMDLVLVVICTRSRI